MRVDVESWGARSYEVVRRTGWAREGAVCVVAVTPGGDVLLVRVFRYPVRETLLEIPAGILDREGEDPAACAARELAEETGHRATSLSRLGGFLTTAGLTDEAVTVFLAEATEEPETDPDAEEVTEVVRVPFGTAVGWARSGRIRDAKTALGLLLAEDRIGRRG